MVGGTVAQRSATALGIRTCSFSYIKDTELGSDPNKFYFTCDMSHFTLLGAVLVSHSLLSRVPYKLFDCFMYRDILDTFFY